MKAPAQPGTPQRRAGTWHGQPTETKVRSSGSEAGSSSGTRWRRPRRPVRWLPRSPRRACRASPMIVALGATAAILRFAASTRTTPTADRCNFGHHVRDGAEAAPPGPEGGPAPHGRRWRRLLKGKGRIRPDAQDKTPQLRRLLGSVTSRVRSAVFSGQRQAAAAPGHVPDGGGDSD
jgi:hypothetical protein